MTVIESLGLLLVVITGVSIAPLPLSDRIFIGGVMKYSLSFVHTFVIDPFSSTPHISKSGISSSNVYPTPPFSTKILSTNTPLDSPAG